MDATGEVGPTLVGSVITESVVTSFNGKFLGVGFSSLP